MAEFWDEMAGAYSSNGSIDTYLREDLSGSHTAVRKLTDAAKKANALPLPVTAGTRVRFVANLGSVLSYDDIPNVGVVGTVITVKTANGIATSQDERVFVLWDDGKFRSIMAEHLRQATNTKQSMSVRMVVADLGDISALFASSGGTDELVHKATQDLWSFKKDSSGYVLERLFDDTGKPLKV
jgi:hypothetical protein